MTSSASDSQRLKQTSIKNSLRGSHVHGLATLLLVLLLPLVVDFETTMKLLPACFQQLNVCRQTSTVNRPQQVITIQHNTIKLSQWHNSTAH